MSTCKASFRLDEQGAARALVGVLTELLEPPPDAASCFEDGSGWRVEAYFTGAPDWAFVRRLAADAAGVAVADAGQLVDVPDLNWVAISQAALPPVSAGRFTIHGRHDRHRIARGPWTIEIDAGEAFGTAHHATTQGCLNALDRLGQLQLPLRRVLDLGCGSAVLAIAAQRIWPSAHVTATDIDPVAVEVAQANVRANGARRIDVGTVAGVPRGWFDLVVANILAGPLIDLAPKVRAALSPGGGAVLSGILIPQAAAVTVAYRAHGFGIVRHERIAGWSTLTLVRRG